MPVISRSVSEKSIEEMALAWPCLFQGVPRNEPRCIPKRKCNHDNVIERADDRQELGNQVDRRQHPEPGEGDDELGPARHSRVSSQPPGRGHAVRQKGDQVPGETWRQAPCEDEEQRPRRGDGRECDTKPRDPVHSQLSSRAAIMAPAIQRPVPAKCNQHQMEVVDVATGP